MKIYIETSVLGFLLATDAPEKMEITRDFFARGAKKHDIYISDLVISEIEKVFQEKSGYFRRLIKEHDFKLLITSKECINLAKKYVQTRIIPEKYVNDAIHIAIAVVNKMGAIASWNMEHIVKLKTIVEVNKINRELGYPEIIIITPEEVSE